MNAPRVVAVVSLLMMIVTGVGTMRASDAQPAAPPLPDATQSSMRSFDVTPSRLSYLSGEVSFWRPGAQDWAPAMLNTALEAGDVIYVAQPGSAEVQIGPRAFVRASEATQLGLDNQEPDFIQFRVTSGHAAIDLREIAPGQTVELDTPNAAFTIDRAGYYRVDVVGDSVSFSTHRGGRAMVAPASGPATPIAPGQRALVTGTDSPSVELGTAAALTAWDQWNYERTADLLRPSPAQYVSAEMYGAQELDRYGAWRTAATYGQVWVPSSVPANWVPYSTGRWIWDPIYGWTWLDDAPWGWAPYHYGRWVFIDNVWAWAPGPRVVRPVYSPAFVVFLGGVSGRPLAWAPLGWGEPVIPWWGRPGFVGVPWWGGWGGPRIVNNVVVKNTTVVNVQNITVYRNVHDVNAVVGVPADRFGRDRVEPTRLARADVQQLAPVHGAVPVKPAATSVMPGVATAQKPPASIQQRGVVSTRPPQDVTPLLRAHGLPDKPDPNRATTPRLVPAPKSAAIPANAAGPSTSSPNKPGANSTSAPASAPTTAAPAQRPTNEATAPSSASRSAVPPQQNERRRPDAVAKPDPSRPNGERRAPDTPAATSPGAQPQTGASREAPPPSPARREPPSARVAPPAHGDRPDAAPRGRAEPQGDASPPPDRPVRPERGPSRDAPPPSSGTRVPPPPVRSEPPARGERSGPESHSRAEPPAQVRPQGNAPSPSRPAPTPPPSREASPRSPSRPEAAAQSNVPPPPRQTPAQAAPSREPASPPAVRSDAPPARGERPPREAPPARTERQERPAPGTP